MKKIIFTSLALLYILTVGYAQNGKKYAVFNTNSSIVYGICFTENGGALGIGDNTTIKVYSTMTKKLLNEFRNGHQSEIFSIDISKDGSLLVSGDREGNIVVWDFVNNKILKKLTYQKGIVTSVKFSPDRRYLLSGGTDKKVFLYDLETDKVVHEFTDHLKDVTSVDFSPDGKLFASASGDKTIKIYDVKTYGILASLSGHHNWVRDISFSKDGTKMISCGDDSRIITWDLSDLHSVMQVDNHLAFYEWVLSVDFDVDSKSYVFGGLDGKVRIISPFGSYSFKIGVPINNVKFNPGKGEYMVTAIATRGKGVIYLDGRDMKGSD